MSIFFRLALLCSTLLNFRSPHLLRLAAFKTARGDFRQRAAIFDHTVRGVLSPPHTSRVPRFATQDHAQARDSNAALGYTRTWRPLWQSYSGRSARVAARPEVQAPPPHVFNLPERLSPLSHGSDRRFGPVELRVVRWSVVRWSVVRWRRSKGSREASKKIR